MEIVRNGNNSTFVRTGKGVFFLRELIADDAAAEVEVGTLAPNPTESLTPYHANPRPPRQTTENFLVIPGEDCRRILEYQGLKEGTGLHLERLIGSGVERIARITAEETEEFRQVITYVFATHK